ncbi:ureidoglycolate lyase [Methylobacterium frigidaeris]|uniref:Ureidoglycolate lyase n=1 Tax=Methylobacterium frigidaeris TaxID=2038277 RepID=A0AA37H947_9HYPH|nr:ureidoglycolate lyase [Methylobacterium frigidaeris]PIK70407.1 ureidoglycolate hydrolase [Methylobacterium frigidaeris]GJD61065.1 Ureidoglycolate lyase [Methylobacterium frigidaeris]
MRTLPIEPITAEAFAPFGTLLVGPAAGPRQDRAAEIENGRPGAALNLALIRSEPFADSLPLRRLERHPHSAQAFLPLAVGEYLVVVAPDAGGRPDETALRAFRVPAGTGIVYRSGAWHAHMTTLSAPGTFAMLVHEDGGPEDCVFAPIAPVTPEA